MDAYFEIEEQVDGTVAWFFWLGGSVRAHKYGYATVAEAEAAIDEFRQAAPRARIRVVGSEEVK